MVDKLRNALTRKLGPLPAWAWGLIAGGALYFYRRNGGISTGSGGSDQQATPSYYGPYGQDSFPIQGGAGTGPGDSGTQDVAPAPGAPPVINVFPNKPTSPGKKKPKPRKHKPKPQHKPPHHKPHSGPTKGEGSPGHIGATHIGKTQTAHGNPNHARPRHPATTHPGSATRPRPTGGAPVSRNVHARNKARH